MNGTYRHRPVYRSQSAMKLGVNGRGTQPANAPDDARLDFSQIWTVIWDGKWIIAFTCLIVAGVVTAYTLQLPKEYSARAIALVKSPPVQAPAGLGASSQERSISNELGKLRYSGDLISSVANQLIQLVDALEGGATPQTFPILFNETGERRTERGIALALPDRVGFTPLGGQDMIAIDAASTVPEEAARIANLYAEEYVRYSQESSRASHRAARAYLEGQVERRKEELDEVNAQIVAFERRNQTVTRGATGGQLVAEYTRYRALREDYKLQQAQEQQRLATLEAELRRLEPELERRMSTDLVVQSLQSQINEFNTRIGQLQLDLEEYYLNDPTLRGNEERIEELEQKLKRRQWLERQRGELVNELSDQTLRAGATLATSGDQLSYLAQVRTNIIEAQSRVQGLEVQLESLDQKLASYDDDLQGIPTLQIERAQLEQQRAMLQQFYTSFLQQLQSNRIAEESELGYIEIVQQAVVPRDPLRPDVQQNIILGVLLGLGLGLGFAFVWQAASSRIRRPEDLQAAGFSVVGQVPRMDREIKAAYGKKTRVEVEGRSVRPSLITLLNPWSVVSENFRLMRSNILRSGTHEVPKVLLVTSPHMGEGKSVVAANLAVTMAKFGSRTLLVDADLRRPTAHMLLGEARAPGLTERLVGVGEPPEPRATPTTNLWVMPAGEEKAPPVELLASREMTQWLGEARSEFDLIIIDSPPILAVSDPVVLAPQADAVLFVVAANETQMNGLEMAAKTLSGVGVEPAGVILNRYEPRKARGYGYGYGYTYGRGYVEA